MSSHLPFDPSAPAPREYDDYDVIPQTVWEFARDSVVSGVSEHVVSRASGIPVAWLQKRAKQEKWLTPARKAEIVKRYRLDDPEVLARVVAELEFAAAAKAASDAQIYESMVAEKTAEAVRKGLETAPPPMDWKSLKIADDMARRSHRLDEKAARGKGALIDVQALADSGERAASGRVVEPAQLPSSEED